MKLDGFDWFMVLGIPFIIVGFGVITYDAQQQRITFQQTYNKNLECRQALKNNTKSFVNEICGPVPVIGDFVK
jgi:hypothetical protein